MEGELILMAFVMLIGQIIMLQMWNMNWFKKENFKIQKKNIEGENRLRLKKLEKELGLKQSTARDFNETPSTMDTLANLLPVLKNLDGDQIGMLIDKFAGGEETSESSEGGLESVLKAIPPEVIEGFISQLGKGKGEKGDTGY